MKPKIYLFGALLSLVLALLPGVSAGAAEGGRQVPHYDIREAGGAWDGTHYYLADGTMATDVFFCDGEFTYYLMANGEPMKNRLTYHPDGEHIIYFDENGHEVFSDFTHVTQSIAGEPVDDLCFFDVFGYMYVDVLTYDKVGVNLYYANPYGVMECDGWFRFSDGRLGCANSDGSLIKDTWGTDGQGRQVYFQGDGSLATGVLYDSVNYYKLNAFDGYLEATVSASSGRQQIMEAICNLPVDHAYAKYEYAYWTGDTAGFAEGDMIFYTNFAKYIDNARQYHTPYEQEKTIHDYLIEQIYYYDASDVSMVYLNSLESVFIDRYAVCGGYANAFQLCMDVLGIECITVHTQIHAWNAVQLEGEWYMVDTTWDDVGEDAVASPGVSYTYFNVSDVEMRQVHGNYSCEIQANGTKYGGDVTLCLTAGTDDKAFEDFLLKNLISDEKTLYRFYIRKADGSKWTYEEQTAYISQFRNLCPYDTNRTSILLGVYEERDVITFWVQSPEVYHCTTDTPLPEIEAAIVDYRDNRAVPNKNLMMIVVETADGKSWDDFGVDKFDFLMQLNVDGVGIMDSRWGEENECVGIVMKNRRG